MNWAQNLSMKAEWENLKAIAVKEIEDTLIELPSPLRRKAEIIPVTFESAPNLGLQADGIAADTLGVFTGGEFTDDGSTAMPPQIVLFLENLWDFAEWDELAYREEIRTTFLHELGHYFGLDEADLAERGLD